MEIKNKEIFKAALRELVEKHIRQFPFYFAANIVINLFLAAGFAILAGMLVYSSGGLISYAIPVAMFLYMIAYVTVGSLIKNLNILHELRSDGWGVDVKDYEWDHLAHFVLDLPMKLEDVRRMKIALSFGKLIGLLDLFGIIRVEGGMCVLDRIYQHDIEKTMEVLAVSLRHPSGRKAK